MTTPGSSASALRCRLGWLPTVEWAGLFVAEAEGLLGAEGLDVEVVPGGPGCPSAAADVADGVVDVGLPSDVLAVVDLVRAGAPLRIVGAVMASSPLGIAWPARRGPVTAAALRGARIGAGATADQRVVEAIFAAADLPPDFTFHLIGPGTDELEAGAVDAMCCSTVSQPLAAARRGLELEVATFAALGLPLPADAVVVGEALAAERPDVVAGFLRALARGWERALAEPAGAVATTLTRAGSGVESSEEDARAELAALAPFVAGPTGAGEVTLAIDRRGLQRTIDLVAADGDRWLDVDRLVDLRPLDQAGLVRAAMPTPGSS